MKCQWAGKECREIQAFRRPAMVRLSSQEGRELVATLQATCQIATIVRMPAPMSSS